MDRYILFTSVGNTDPITKNKEGAILQICRKYKPEKIYMFLSQQIYENHKKDDRYRLCIRKLAESIDGFNPEIEIIAEKSLEDVHKFDIYYEIYEGWIERIRDEYPEHKILLNISSGTPAMKSALNLIAALHDSSIMAVQVAAPETQYKMPYAPFDVETEWANNLDNNQPSSNEERVKEEKNLNLIARFKKEMILKHISVYDYNAAYSIAQDISDSLPPVSLKLLKAACCRLQLDEDNMKKALEGTGYDFTSYANGYKRNIAEYLLWLQIQEQRHDYADFIRGITPVVADLFEIILEHHTGIHLPDYCVEKKFNGYVVYEMSRKKLVETEKGQEILDILDKHFLKTIGKPMRDDEHYTSRQTSILIKHYINGNSKLVDAVNKIRSVEGNVRNLAAHEIVSITDEWIKNRCKMNSEEIMNKLKYLASEAGITDSDNLWSSYDRMNQIIKENII